MPAKMLEPGIPHIMKGIQDLSSMVENDLMRLAVLQKAIKSAGIVPGSSSYSKQPVVYRLIKIRFVVAVFKCTYEQSERFQQAGNQAGPRTMHAHNNDGWIHGILSYLLEMKGSGNGFIFTAAQT